MRGKGVLLVLLLLNERRRGFTTTLSVLFSLLQRPHIHYDGAYQKRVLITSSTEEGTDIYLRHSVRER